MFRPSITETCVHAPEKSTKNQKHPLGRCFFGGEGGIRTREPLWVTRFPSVRAKPATQPLRLSGANYTRESSGVSRTAHPERIVFRWLVYRSIGLAVQWSCFLFLETDISRAAVGPSGWRQGTRSRGSGPRRRYLQRQPGCKGHYNRVLGQAGC